MTDGDKRRNRLIRLFSVRLQNGAQVSNARTLRRFMGKANAP
jgi:hypothetical protein